MYCFSQYKPIVYDIIGAAMEVHRTSGHGLLEGIYAEALHIELCDRGIDNELEKEIECHYKSHKLEKKYRMDMVLGDVCVELKSVVELIPAHRAQLFNYLRLTKKPVGLLINFGSRRLEGERYVYVEEANECFLADREMNLQETDNDE